MQIWTQLISFENTEVAFRSKSDTDLKRAYLLFSMMNNNTAVQVGKFLLRFAMTFRLPVKWMIKGTIFKQFCGGEDMVESAAQIEALAAYNVRTILDYSVEGKDSEKDFDASFRLILDTIENAAGNPSIPFAVFKVTGMASNDLLAKVSGSGKLNEKEKEAYQRVIKRVEGICRRGFELDVPILIDAEESWIQPAIDQLAESMMIHFNKEKAIVYNTAQLYRHDRLAYLKTSLEMARKEGLIYGVKLVRGAYMEKERDRAERKGYPSPINPDKTATDRDFDEALKYCIDNLDHISFCCGSHNEKSSLLLVNLMKEKGLEPNDERIYFAQLLGMSDHISYNLSNAGYNVAKYVPFGPVYDVTPYLIRRTEENTSVAGQSSRELGLISKEISRRKSS